mgnify:CR=1 FL=1|jgi:transposase-like protein
MSRKNRKYTVEFKLEAIQLAAHSEKTLSAIEQDLGITPGLLSKWRKRYQVNEETQRLELTDIAASLAFSAGLSQPTAI